jgi:thioredoxin 1
MITPLRQQDLEQVLNSPKAVLKFWAPWCGPCKALNPLVDKVAQDQADVAFYSVDIDQEPALAQRFGVRAVPTLVGLQAGGTAFVHVGLLSEGALRQRLTALA